MIHLSRRRGLASALAALAVVTCGGETNTVGEGATTEVPIVALPETPVFRAHGGLVDGDSVFFDAILEGELLEGGSSAISLGRSREIVFLDSLGGTTGVRGGAGPGPAEFRLISELFQRKGELVAWDERNRRLTFFEGDVMSGERPVAISPDERWVGLLNDSVYVSTRARPSRVALLTAGADAWSKDATEARDAPQWFVARSIDSGDSLAVIRGPVAPPPPSLLLEIPTAERPLYASFDLGQSCLPATRWVVVEDSLLLVDSGDGSVIAAVPGTNRSVLAGHPPRERVDRAFIQAIEGWISRTERELGAATGSSKQAVRGRIGPEGAPLPSVWSGVIEDPPSRVWLRHAECSAEPKPERWRVVALDGTMLGEVILPLGHQLLAARADRVLVRSMDDFDVESVGVFELNAPWN